MADRPHTSRSRNRQSRGKGLRKTTGCITCRKRHVKCDEIRPVCGRCLKGSYTCIFSIAQSVSTRVSHEDPVDAINGLPQEAAPAVHTAAQHQAQEHLPQQPELVFSHSNTHNQQNRHSPDHQESLRLHVQNDGFIYDGSASSTSVPMESDVPPLEALSADTATGFSMGSNGSMRAVSPSSHPSYNAAVTRWFDLLAADADLDTAKAFENAQGQTAASDVVDLTRGGEQTDTSFSYSRLHRTLSATSSSQILKERGPVDDALRAAEKQKWLSSTPLSLLPHEHVLFQNFTQHISRWLDLFDPDCNFSAFVPHLALHNLGLMKAILTLSARHLSLNPGPSHLTPDRNDALQYYNETLHFLAEAMQYDTYTTSLELLATALIVSAYEMLDGAETDWERHLKGVFWIQRSQVIHGDSKGLKQAVWWAWLCQDIWAAFREKRKTLTFWKPVRAYEDMNPHELAARSVFLVARVIDYCSREEFEAWNDNIAIRIQEADRLTRTLEDWHQFLTVEFNPLPWPGDSHPGSSVFEPIWINPPAFGVAIQLYNVAKLLLLLNSPSRGGLNEFTKQLKETQNCIANVCGIAMTLTDYASSILSSQCLYITGTCVQEHEKRAAVLELLDRCQRRTGWPVLSLNDQLRMLWERNDG